MRDFDGVWMLFCAYMRRAYMYLLMHLCVRLPVCIPVFKRFFQVLNPIRLIGLWNFTAKLWMELWIFKYVGISKGRDRQINRQTNIQSDRRVDRQIEVKRSEAVPWTSRDSRPQPTKMNLLFITGFLPGCNGHSERQPLPSRCKQGRYRCYTPRSGYSMNLKRCSPLSSETS